MLAGAGGLLLLVFMFALDWYGGASRSGGSVNGWQALASLRWLLLVTIAVALWLVFAQTSRRAPAVPVTLSVIVAVLGILSTLALVYRVLIDPPAHRQAGAYLGLLAALGIAVAGWLSMRQEGIASQDERTDIPIVRPGPSRDPRISGDARS